MVIFNSYVSLPEGNEIWDSTQNIVNLFYYSILYDFINHLVFNGVFFFGNIFIEEWLGVLINPGIPVTGKSAGGGMVFPLGTGISTGVP